MNFTIFIFILKIITIILLPSDDIWNQTLQYIDEGLMYNFNNKHFIFDEGNFTALDIDDEKMKDLYNKQEKIFRKYGIASYIFAVNYINESLEEIGSIRNNTRDNLRNNGYYVDNSIFTVFSIDTIKGLIYTGKNTKSSYISNDNAKYMKEKIINNLENENYYKAWDDFLDDIIYFCDKAYEDFLFNNNKTSKPYDDTNNNNIEYSTHSNSKALELLGSLVGCIIIIGIIISLICCCKKCNKYNKYTVNDKNSNNDFSYGGYSGGNNSIGGYSGGNNSIGGYSGGNNSIGGNSGCSGGYSGGNISIGGNSGCSGGA